jgi:hypothetical protein
MADIRDEDSFGGVGETQSAFQDGGKDDELQ